MPPLPLVSSHRRAYSDAYRPVVPVTHAGVPSVALRLALGLVLLLALVGLPTPAFAHGGLKSSQPASGAHLAAVPRELRLTFTEAPALAFTRVDLRDPSGAPVPLGALSVATDSRRTVVTAIHGALAAGSYAVAWQMAGDDGHVTRGRFSFTIAPGAAGTGSRLADQTSASGSGSRPAPDTRTDSAARRGESGSRVTAPGQAPPPAAHHNPVSMPEGTDFGAESPLYVAIRWLQFVGLLIAIGAVAFARVVLGALRRRGGSGAFVAAARQRAAHIGLWATGALALAALLRLLAQSYAMHGPGEVLDARVVAPMLAQTVWGWGWLLQTGAVVLAAISFRSAARGRGPGWTLAAGAALLLAFTPALSGHAASAPRFTPLAILADGLHVLGASGWLGSLLLVLAAGIPAAMRLGDKERGSAVRDLVHAFSPTALAFAGLVALTGVFAGWLHLGAVSALWRTAYGRTLLVKLGVLSVVAATGAYNWLRVRPALGDTAGAARLRRSATVELAVGVVVVAVTAVLVATPTAMDVQAMNPSAVKAPPGSAAEP